jgi:hypothetical protein
MTVGSQVGSFLHVLEGDFLTVVAQPLGQLLQQIKPAQGQPPSVEAMTGAWIQFHASLIPMIGQVAGLTLGQIISSMQAKLAQYQPPAPPGTTS